ncbi:MAG: hypothetical protein JWP38_2559 [Herbaspirillum sp.]|nr:hypothetical protein [Herbaspirillum sp.]
MKKISLFSLMAWAMLQPFPAEAHVKWFVEFDTTNPPLPILQVIEAPDFWGVLLLSIIVIYVTSVWDRKLTSPANHPRWQPLLSQLYATIPQVMRYGTSMFFLILAIGFPHILLTPELISDNPYLRYVHFLIALTAFYRPTSFIAGIGIIFLYSYSIQLYGLFHMLDYVMFVGTGVFLVLQTWRKGVVGGELELLRLTFCYSFIWGAIEKFLQPALFYQLLTDHPYIAMGLDWEFFVRTCGFIELCCVYHIYTGKTAAYAAIGVLTFFVLLALIPFGLIDFIGHFLFIIPMIAILFAPRKEDFSFSALTNTGLFLLTSCVFFLFSYGSYYVLHYHLHG